MDLKKSLHIRFFKHFLNSCPSSLSDQESNRMTIGFFALGGIDILNGIESVSPQFREEIIEWIYHLQVLPLDGEESETPQICGFQGTSTLIVKDSDRYYEAGNLAMTYTALCSLLILGDDLSRVNRTAVINGVRQLQRPNGSFQGSRDLEADMRYVYCAACICYILNDFSGINLDSMVNYIKDSLAYDGGLGQGPGLESHGGSTFCGLAALHLTSSQQALSSIQVERLKRWCIHRQRDGFHGRPNKPDDTCYSFWLGGTLALLGAYEWVHAPANRDFIMSTQDPLRGGFSKWPDGEPDFLHAFFGLAGLSLMGEEGLAPVEPLLCITQRAHAFLKQLHDKW